jgi:hypothetical protein
MEIQNIGLLKIKMYQDEKKPKARKNTFGRSGF